MTRRIPNPVDEPTLTVERASAIVGVTKVTGYRNVRANHWPHVKVGGTVAIPTRKFLALYDLLDEIQNLPAGAEAAGGND